MPAEEIWAVDFEYRQTDLCGELPEIRCFCAAEMRSGTTIQYWVNELADQPPISMGSQAIILAHNWKAEISCFKVLGWPDPQKPIDTMIEADRVKMTAGAGYRPTSLKRLLEQSKLPAIEEKEEMRELAMENRRSALFAPKERQALLDYCLEDCLALLKLWPKIQDKINSYMPDEETAFFWAYRRAKYVFCCADCDLYGVPVDQGLWDKMISKQPQIHSGLHAKLKEQYGCSDGVAHFKIAGLKQYIQHNQLKWPMTPTGLPKTDEATLDRMAATHPQLIQFADLFKTLRKARAGNLNIHNGRCYSKIWPFAQAGTRNSAKSNFIFAAARWLRGLIKPEPGTGIAYLDYGREEVLIQAVLAQCPAYLRAYYSEDMHTANGKRFGLIVEGMDKASFKAARTLAKTCTFRIQYGGQAVGLSQSLGIPLAKAEQIIRAYRRDFPEIQQWRQRVESTAIAQRYLLSPDGSVLKFNENINPRTACNFPIQATGAAILRWTQIRLREQGIKVLCPVHDAILVEYPLDTKEETLRVCQEEMVTAGKLFLNENKLLVDVENEVTAPDSFPTGNPEIWDMVMELIH